MSQASTPKITAKAEQAVPREYHAAITAERDDLRKLGACFREFSRHFSARAVTLVLLASIIARIAIGRWDWRDLLVPVAIIVLQPFAEWFIHKYLLHLKPFEFRGRKVDIYTAAAHRRHHKRPADLDRVLLHAPEVIASMVAIAGSTVLVTALATLVIGGQLVPLILTGLVCSYAGLLRYEWSHFLIHTPYIPKSKFFRSIWRSHRLHHFKHEDYWMGVSSNFGDRVLGTFPEQATIPKSETARTLGVDSPAESSGTSPG